MRLFKYLKPEHAESLVSNGEIRIGTLYEYRDSEDERADKLEGARQYRITGESIHSLQNSIEAEYLRSQGITNCTFSNSHPNGALFVTERVSKDSYIFCTSNKFDKKNMKKFGGACIKIKNSTVFFSIITDFLKEKGLVTGKCETEKIVYCPRDKVYKINEDVPQAIPGWRIKPNAFKPEEEVRAMWASTAETDLKPALAISEFVTYRTLEPLMLSISKLCISGSYKRIV